MTETELPHPMFGLHSSPTFSYFWPYRPKSATAWSAIKGQLCLHVDLQDKMVFYLAATGQSSSPWNFTIKRTHREDTFNVHWTKPQPLSPQCHQIGNVSHGTTGRYISTQNSEYEVSHTEDRMWRNGLWCVARSISGLENNVNINS